MLGKDADPDRAKPLVLVVDDDRSALEEMRDLVTANGMECLCAGNALDALMLIDANPELRILVVDLNMPMFNGLDLIQKAAENSRIKPIASIVVSGQPRLDAAIGALRHSVVDFLLKPLLAHDLLFAIDRARSRLVELDLLRRNGPQSAVSANMSALAKVLKANFDILDGRQILEPTWAILIDMLDADTRGQKLSLTSAGLGASTSSSTLLRRVNELVSAGILIRENDENDGRRTYLSFSPAGRAEVARLVAQITNADETNG